MRIYNIYDFIRNIIGSIDPYGSQGIDKERLNNLEEHMELTYNLVLDLRHTASYKDRPESSMKMLGQKADEALKEIRQEDELFKKIKKLREMIYGEDIPHPTVPEYRELHDKMLKFLKFIDDEILKGEDE